MSHHIICGLATKEQLIILQITQRVNITPNMVRERNSTFLTPLIFFALFLRSFICFLDFSTFVANPFCEETPKNTLKQEYLKNLINWTAL
jgi:hypothetical protein